MKKWFSKFKKIFSKKNTKFRCVKCCVGKNLILPYEIRSPRFFFKNWIKSKGCENKADGNVLRDISENNPRQTEREGNSVSSKGI